MMDSGHNNPAFIDVDGHKVDDETNSSLSGKTSLSTQKVGEEKVERAQWGGSLEFLMSCIAMNVGLGNIWRFPFVAYENGGGAFLIPYLTVLIILGRPMYYLEVCLGQFSSKGNVKMFEGLAPALKGVGYGQLIGTISVATYYCSLMGLTLFYLVNSFTANLPWSECDPSWKNTSWLANDMGCLPSKAELLNGSSNYLSSAELWFRIEALKETTDISNGLGSPEWRLTVCLLVAWIVTFLICAKGVQSAGKASYFLAIFPYVILFALLIRSVTLEGAGTGILYFVEPKWEMLLSAKVWYSAVTQCFFSLNIGFGSVTTYASYNRFGHNCHRDAMVVTTLDTMTSCLAGCIIFGILGNLALKMGVDVSDVVKSGGTGLAFISYPEAIAKFDIVPWLFAILFFFMLFVLGIGSLVALVGCAFTAVLDAFPNLKTWHVSLTASIIGFIIGLVYTTPGGQWIFTMVDYFGGTFIFYVLAIMEIVSISWWYGLEEICLDIEYMSKRKPGIYWRVCWGILTPIVLIIVFIYFIATLEPLRYENKLYPTNVIAFGWLLLGFGLIQPIVWFSIDIFQRKTTMGWQKAYKSMFVHDNWSPTHLSHDWEQFKQKARAERCSRNNNWFMDKLYLISGR